VFTISSPDVGQVIRKRLSFCQGLVDDETERRRLLPEALDPQAATLSTYLKVLHGSFRARRELVECLENLSGGNVRAALGFVNTFVGSGHVDTRKILDITDETGRYTVALHEFVRSIIFGDYHYYDSAISPIANVFDISAPDGREHFLLPIVLAHVARLGEIVHQDGYVDVGAILSLSQSLGFLPAQVEFALRHAAGKRLLQIHPTDDVTSRRYRITTVGAYTYRRLMGSFVYLDAVVVDTPIVDVTVVDHIKDCRDIEHRVERAQLFRAYLDAQWQVFEGKDLAFSWPHVSEPLDTDFRRIDHAVAQQH
jgi:hypothetical protein